MDGKLVIVKGREGELGRARNGNLFVLVGSGCRGNGRLSSRIGLRTLDCEKETWRVWRGVSLDGREPCPRAEHSRTGKTEQGDGV